MGPGIGQWLYWRNKSEQPTTRSNGNINRAVYLRASRDGLMLIFFLDYASLALLA